MGTLTDLQARVGRGIAKLNKHGPRGWRKKLRTEMKRRPLRMNYLNACVLGMLYGASPAGLKALGIRGTGAEYGFAVRWRLSDGKKWKDLGVLEALWCKALNVSSLPLN